MRLCKGNFTDSYKKTIGVDFLERHLRFFLISTIFYSNSKLSFIQMPGGTQRVLWGQALMTIGFKYSISSSWEIVNAYF